MNKLIIIFIVFLGSLSLFPFKGGSLDFFVGDSIRHLEPEEKYIHETKIVYELVERYHYRKLQLDDSLSSVILDNYLSSLDYNRSFLLKEDVRGFERYRTKLDDAIKNGNLNPAFDIYNVFQDHFVERMEFVDSVLNLGFDFDADESFEAARSKKPWLNTREEQDEVWRKSLKGQALSLKLSGKDEAGAIEVLEKRYDRYTTVIRQYKPSDVYQVFMNAFTEAYDPHTNYFNPITAENFDIEMSRSLEGIGARLSKEGDYTIVVEIVPGGPAYRSNQLHKDDKITGVGQGDKDEIVDVVGWRNDDVVQLIRGKKGTIVRLLVLKAEDGLQATPKIVRLERDKINLEDQRASSKVYFIEENNQPYRLGVITIPDFYKDFRGARRGDKEFNSTTRDVRQLLAKLSEDEIDGLLIDLRRNGGGALDEAIDLTGLFIKDGPVVQVRDRANEIDVGKDESKGVYYEGPLTVLINRSSASASEIFTGAIQDYKRGVILGEQSFGKGTVQNLIDLNRVVRFNRNEKLGNLKITLAKYYRITGSSTQNVGITPDIALPSGYDPATFGESSMPASLPWDQISSTRFTPSDQVNDDLLDALNRVYLADLNADPDLRKLVEDINRRRERREQTVVSLNESQRRKENEELDEDLPPSPSVQNDQESIVVEAPEPTLVDIDDPYLKESLRLLATLVAFNVG